MIDQPSDLTRVLEAKLRDRREFTRLFGSDEERRLLLTPPGTSSPGMLERINRAVKELEAETDAGHRGTSPSARGEPGPPEGLPLPGS